MLTVDVVVVVSGDEVVVVVVDVVEVVVLQKLAAGPEGRRQEGSGSDLRRHERFF